MSPQKTKMHQDFITEFTAHGKTYLLAEVKDILPGGIKSKKLVYLNVSEGLTTQIALSTGAAVICDLKPIDDEDVIRLIGHEIVKKEAK